MYFDVKAINLHEVLVELPICCDAGVTLQKVQN